MADETGPSPDEKPALGGELLLPALAVALTVYFLIDVADLTWEARANATVIAYVLLALIAIHLVRIALKLRAGEATLAIGDLLAPRILLPTRLAVLAITAAFIVALPWLGLTLGLFLAVAALMRLLRAGSWRKIALTAGTIAVAAYLLFIALLNTRLPRGPVEKLLAGLFWS
jgi:hypothetical protein